MFDWLKKLFGGGEPSPSPAPAPRPSAPPQADAPLPQTFALRSGKVPVKIFSLQQGIEEWHMRRASYAQTGKWPVLLTGEMLQQGALGENLDFESAEEVLEAAANVDAADLMRGRLAEFLDDVGENLEGGEYDEPDLATIDMKGRESNQFNIFGILKSKQVGLIEIPVSNPADIFAHIAFGNWNEVPTDDQLVACFRYWNQQHGAVPAVVSTDVIECWLDQPVNSPEVSSDLAMEQAGLCVDIVDQGVGTVHNLAEAIWGAKVWYFWWD
jgi:predicted CoA-binding protein